MKKCRGGAQPYKALWMFNILVNAKTMEELNDKRSKAYPLMQVGDKAYLNSIPDEEQYPAARCAKSEVAIMYGRSSSSSVESMNAANKSMRQRSSVDLVNATILLMQMERDRFNRMREEAWRHESDLTPYGLKAADEISNEVPNYRLFDYNYKDDGD
jgi:hypothetical protein